MTFRLRLVERWDPHDVRRGKPRGPGCGRETGSGARGSERLHVLLPVSRSATSGSTTKHDFSTFVSRRRSTIRDPDRSDACRASEDRSKTIPPKRRERRSREDEKKTERRGSKRDRKEVDRGRIVARRTWSARRTTFARLGGKRRRRTTLHYEWPNRRKERTERSFGRTKRPSMAMGSFRSTLFSRFETSIELGNDPHVSRPNGMRRPFRPRFLRSPKGSSDRNPVPFSQAKRTEERGRGIDSRSTCRRDGTEIHRSRFRLLRYEGTER